MHRAEPGCTGLPLSGAFAVSICELDHIAVTAPTLQAGVDWVHDVLGVAPAGGGEQPAMGTHNHL
ncbi:MAG: VOC family protein, partial [Betaproteobacteria bacterium]